MNGKVIVGETTSYYNSTNNDHRDLIILIDDYIYFVSTLDKDEDLYKEFIISQTATRCDRKFYKRHN